MKGNAGKDGGKEILGFWEEGKSNVNIKEM